jgi:hypothetical protein
VVVGVCAGQTYAACVRDSGFQDGGSQACGFQEGVVTLTGALAARVRALLDYLAARVAPRGGDDVDDPE